MALLCVSGAALFAASSLGAPSTCPRCSVSRQSSFRIADRCSLTFRTGAQLNSKPSLLSDWRQSVVQSLVCSAADTSVHKEFFVENSAHNEHTSGCASCYSVVPQEYAPVRDRSMASYVETISALHEQRVNSGEPSNLGHESGNAGGLAVVKALERRYNRDVFIMKAQGRATLNERG